jgi:hypothetical protein
MKFLRRFDQRDRQIFTVATILLLLSLGLTLFDDWVYRFTDTGAGDLQSIGKVRMTKLDVRRRFKVAFSWSPLKNDTAIFQGDSIFTGENSEAVITTDNGEEITIAPNSLVVINSKKDSLAIDIGFGSVEGKVGKGGKLVVASNNNITELAGDNATIKIDAGAGDRIVLNVLEGQVKVRSSEGEAILGRNDAAEVNLAGSFDSQKSQSPIQLLAPAAEERVRFGLEQPLQFKWNNPKRLGRLKLKVSTDEKLTSLLLDVPVQGDSYVAYGLPADQKLYWKIVAEGADTSVQNFWILDNKPPYLLLPLQGQQIFTGKDVELKWNGGSPARRYEVQLSRNDSFTTIFQQSKTEQSSWVLSGLEKGAYYWRVRGLEFKDSPWSQVGYFNLNQVPTEFLAPPRTEFEPNLLILTRTHQLPPEKVRDLTPTGARKLIASPPVLAWSKVKNAERYQLQVSRSTSFNDPVVNVTVEDTRFTWWSALPGNYYWRIRSLGEEFKTPAFTQAKPLQIAVAAPTVLSSATFLDEVPDESLLHTPPPPIDLQWNPTVYTEEYEVVFADNAEMKNANRFLTRLAKKTIRLPKPGRYFWTIRALGKKQVPISNTTSLLTLDYQRVYKDPALSENLIAMSPKQGESILLVGQGTATIDFRWNNPPETTQFELEIAHDMNFANVVKKVSTRETRYAFKDPFLSSLVYWRVRALHKGAWTEWTAANRFLVSYENSPFDIETSEKIQIARFKAKERQDRLLVTLQRKIDALRLPAAATDIQLETPVSTFTEELLILKDNVAPNADSVKLARKANEEFFKMVLNPPVLTWQKVPAAERYFVEIASDTSFKNVISRVPSFNPYYLWETVRPGQFYWRIQAFNDRYRRSDFSEVRPLRVEIETLESSSPDNFVEVFDEPTEMWPTPAPFTISWTPRAFAKFYEFEFSEDPNFTVSKTFRSKENQKVVNVSKTGTYFWRARPVNDYGVGVARWTQARSLEVAQARRSPASLQRLTGVFPKERDVVFVGQGLMNLMFHFLSPSSDAAILEISDRADFKKVIAQTKAIGTTARVRQDLPAGNLFWRLRKPDGKDEGSDVSDIYQFRLLKEPKSYQPAKR